MKATQESINIENQHTENINWEEKKRNFNNWISLLQCS
jgi:hypothetical protein